jgi:hypothetical protein
MKVAHLTPFGKGPWHLEFTRVRRHDAKQLDECKAAAAILATSINIDPFLAWAFGDASDA